MTDVIVVGGGPAGRALVHRLLHAGVTTTLVDPAPHRRWTATYAAWTDELPHWLPTESIAAQVDSVDIRSTEPVRIARGYTVFDSRRLHQLLSVGEARVVDESATEVGAHEVTTRSGAVLTAASVIDARGATGGGPRQTAWGIAVPRRQAQPVLDGAEAVLMDWTPTGDDDSAEGSFLYAIPLDDDRVLLEETCLAGQPAIPIPVLRNRLRQRLTGMATTALSTEVVSFGLRGHPAPWRSHPCTFGARGGLLHPATGFSVAASLNAADTVAEAVAAGQDPIERLWPRQARMVYRLRHAGLRAVLEFDADQMRRFFDIFAQLPIARQRAYLSDRRDVMAVTAAMATMFRAADTPTRHILARSAVAGVLSAAGRATPG